MSAFVAHGLFGCNGLFLEGVHAPDRVVAGDETDEIRSCWAFAPPPVPELTLTADLVRELLPDLAFERCEELEREVIEGRGHTGQASVVQAIGRRVE